MEQVQYRDLFSTGPETPAGKFLRTFWHPVFVSEKLEKGQAKPVKVMDQAFTLFRGLSGKAFLVQSRCPHRGVQLQSGWVEDDCIRCMYHGWQFDGDGNCTDQPGETEDYKKNVKIKTYPVEEYLGLVFAWLGDGEPGPLPRYPKFEQDGVLSVRQYTRNSNYFYTLDNHSDDVHVIFAHRDSVFTKAGLSLVPIIEAEETEYGMQVVSRFSNGKSRVSQLLMPTILMFKSSPAAGDGAFSDRCAWRVPIDDHSHYTFSVDLRHLKGEAAEKFREAQIEVEQRMAGLESPEHVAQQILNGDRRLTDPDVLARPDLVNIQDNVAQMSQPTVDEPYTEFLGRSDRGVLAFRRIWLREVRAMEECQPLKKWTAPESLVLTTGTDG